MMLSSKADIRAAAAVEFSHRHKWAKYPCIAAVSAIYSAEYIKRRVCEMCEEIREAAEAPFRPLGGRVVSLLLSGAFALMVMPFAAPDAYADEVDTATETSQQEEKAKLPHPSIKLPPHPVTAATPEKIAERVTLSGLAETEDGYGIILNIRTLKKDVTARFSENPKYQKLIIAAFSDYGIPTDDLDIRPVDITIFTTEEKYKLQLSEGYSADITLPIPDDMKGHLDDLKVVRLENDGKISILESSISVDEEKNTISFNTEHFSVFALVAYKDKLPEPEIVAENIGSGAGVTPGGYTAVISVSTGLSVFEEDRNRFKRNRKHKVYRIKRIAKEKDLLLL